MGEELAQLLQDMRSSEWKTILRASDMLAMDYQKELLLHLIQMLESESSLTRDGAALALREIGDGSAVEPLFRAILNPWNHGRISTLVYALERLDCRCHFLDIINLVLAEAWDVKTSAFQVLCDQGFMVSDEEVKHAQQMLVEAQATGNDDERLRAALLRLQDFLPERKEAEDGRA